MEVDSASMRMATPRISAADDLEMTSTTSPDYHRTSAIAAAAVRQHIVPTVERSSVPRSMQQNASHATAKEQLDSMFSTPREGDDGTSDTPAMEPRTDEAM